MPDFSIEQLKNSKKFLNFLVKIIYTYFVSKKIIDLTQKQSGPNKYKFHTP